MLKLSPSRRSSVPCSCSSTLARMESICARSSTRWRAKSSRSERSSRSLDRSAAPMRANTMICATRHASASPATTMRTDNIMLSVYGERLRVAVRGDRLRGVWIELSQVVERLLGGFGERVLPRLQSGARDRHHVAAEPRQPAAFRLLFDLGRFGERGLRDAQRGGADEEARLRRRTRRVREREEPKRKREVR